MVRPLLRRARPGLVVTAAVTGTLGWMAWTAQRRGRLDAELIAAVQRADARRVAVVLRQGADPDASERGGDGLAHEVLGALHKILRGRPVHRDGGTALQLAAQDGNAAVVEALLNGGADANAGAPGSERPLISAILYGRNLGMPNAAAELLLRHGANANARSLQGNPALVQAALANRPELIQPLLEHGAHADATGSGGRTALAVLAFRPHIPGATAAVRALLSAGADANLAHPLEEACAAGVPETARLLLAHRANPNAVSRSRHTPLTRAASYLLARPAPDRTEVIRLLLDHGAEPLRHSPGIATAQSCATRARNSEVIGLLKRAAARRTRRHKEIRTPIEERV